MVVGFAKNSLSNRGTLALDVKAGRFRLPPPVAFGLTLNEGSRLVVKVMTRGDYAVSAGRLWLGADALPHNVADLEHRHESRSVLA